MYRAHTADSSIGRAEDCSRFRLLSSGRWFDSGSADFFDVVVRTQKNTCNNLLNRYTMK